MDGDSRDIVLEYQKTGDPKLKEAIGTAIVEVTENFGRKFCRSRPWLYEEVCSQSITCIWENIKKYRGESTFETFVGGVIKYRFLNSVKAEKREYRKNQNNSKKPAKYIFETHGEERAEYGELEAEVERGVGLLPPECQEVLNQAIEGLSYQEISLNVGMTLDSVKCRIHRARMKLQAHLLRRGYANAE